MQHKMDRERAAALYNEGKSDGAIAHELGVTASAVQQWRRRNHLPAKNGGHPTDAAGQNGAEPAAPKLSSEKPPAAPYPIVGENHVPDEGNLQNGPVPEAESARGGHLCHGETSAPSSRLTDGTAVIILAGDEVNILRNLIRGEVETGDVTLDAVRRYILLYEKLGEAPGGGEKSNG